MSGRTKTITILVTDSLKSAVFKRNGEVLHKDVKEKETLAQLYSIEVVKSDIGFIYFKDELGKDHYLLRRALDHLDQ